MNFSRTTPKLPVQDRLALTGTDDDVLDTLRAYRAAGVDEIIVAVTSADLELNKNSMPHIMQRVWPKL